MRTNRLKVFGADAVYHCMTRTVNGERLFNNREKEILRKMIWQVAEFSGVRVLTYCVMSNHFHVLVEVPNVEDISDLELMRRYKLLYPKPTKYQEASIRVLEKVLVSGGEEAEAIRQRLRLRMGDVSKFMKTVKQRFTIWFNKSHGRYGTLWADRFKSVLVEGKGNPLQTMAAYIDLNPVRAGIVKDPKDYRFCGYAEAVAGNELALEGLTHCWADFAGGQGSVAILQAHRSFIFGKGGNPWEMKGRIMKREQVVKVLEQEDSILPASAALRCRVRYFTDGVILGSTEYVRGFTEIAQQARRKKRPLGANPLKGADWGNLAVIQSLRREVFS